MTGSSDISVFINNNGDNKIVAFYIDKNINKSNKKLKII